jgi:hypothetical protein
MEQQSENPKPDLRQQYEEYREGFELDIENILEDRKTILEQLIEERQVLWLKWRKKLGLEKEWADMTYTLGEKMDGPDKSRYAELLEAERQFDKRACEFYQELVTFLARDKFSEWTRRPPAGVEGSPAATYTQDYETKLGEKFSAEISWDAYPRWVRNQSLRLTPPTTEELAYLETEDEGFSISVRGPDGSIYLSPSLASIRVAQRSANDREYTFEKDVASFFDPETLEKFKQDLLMLGRELQDELGYPERK